MTNQHQGLSQALAEQHRTELQEQATRQRPVPAARPRRRQRAWSPRRWWQLLAGRPSPRTTS
jgi:hypothetical protein